MRREEIVASSQAEGVLHWAKSRGLVQDSEKCLLIHDVFHLFDLTSWSELVGKVPDATCYNTFLAGYAERGVAAPVRFAMVFIF